MSIAAVTRYPGGCRISVQKAAVFGVVIEETSCIILIQMFVIYIQLNCASGDETHVNIMFWPTAF